MGIDWVVFVVTDESTGGVSIVVYSITCLDGMLYSSTGSRDRRGDNLQIETFSD